MSSDSRPIATYRERLPQVSRHLELYGDRVVVTARWLLGRRYTMTIPLDTLNPQPREFWVRQRLFKRALSVAALAVAAAVVFSRPGDDGLRFGPAVVYTLWAIGVVAGVVAMRSFPKVLFARFSARTGRAGLDIARAGPDAAAFGGFVDQVRRRIARS